jgi:transportin-1
VLTCSRDAQYQRKNVRHAYDALTTLASSVHTALAEPSIMPLFVPQLLAKWQARARLCRCFALCACAHLRPLSVAQSLAADDREQLPLLEALTAVIPCLGVGFQQYAAPVFQRCIALAQQQLQYKQAGEYVGPDYEPEFLVRRPSPLRAAPA